LVLPGGHPRVYFGAGLGLLRACASGSDWEAVRTEAMAVVRNPGPPLVLEAEPDGGLLRLAFAFAGWREPYAATAPEADAPPPVRLISLSPRDPIVRWPVVAALRLSEHDPEPPLIGPGQLDERGLAVKVEAQPGLRFELNVDFEKHVVVARRD
jgi:hypothetical protein